MLVNFITEDKFIFSNQLNPEESFTDSWYYKVKKPSTVHAGVGLFFNNINLLYEFEFTDWRDLKFSSNSIYEEDLNLPSSIVINNQIRETFTSTNSHHFGIAVHIPKFPLHLFAGYQYLPVPFENQYNNNIRQSYSCGFSFMIQKNISLQSSWSKYMWDYEGNPESYEKVSLGFSIHSLDL